MMNEKESLWSRVIPHKYCKGENDLDSISARSNASVTWKGIVENLDTLKKGVSYVVTDGCKTLFWKHA